MSQRYETHFDMSSRLQCYGAKSNLTSFSILADVINMVKYIKDVHGFQDENITILLDDGEHEPPTKENIINAYKKIVAEAQPGDSLFCHYSGMLCRDQL